MDGTETRGAVVTVSAARRETALEGMARYATSLSLRDLPPEVISKVKTCFLDAMSGCFAIRHDARARAALQSVSLDQSDACATVVGTAHRAAPTDAAFVNAVATGSTDRSDTHIATATHPGIVVIPAALAVAEKRNMSGAGLIEAMVAGYETMLSVGVVVDHA